MKHQEQREKLVIQTSASAVSNFVKEKSSNGQGIEGEVQKWTCPGDGLVDDIFVWKISFLWPYWIVREKQKQKTAFRDLQMTATPKWRCLALQEIDLCGFLHSPSQPPSLPACSPAERLCQGLGSRTRPLASGSSSTTDYLVGLIILSLLASDSLLVKWE